MVPAGGVYQLDPVLHDAEVGVQAVSIKNTVLWQLFRRQEAAAGDALRRRDARQLKDGGLYIGNFRQAVHSQVVGDAASCGRDNEQRHMGRAFKEQVFLGHVVIPQHFPMIEGENDPGVPEQIVFPHGAEKAAQGIVDLGDAGIIGPS